MIFECVNCKKEVDTQGNIGTRNRNHCPFCLHSLHLDRSIPGDRKEACRGVMKPIGITFKNERKDKYGKEEVGEIMIIHECSKCNVISKNRIAGDDSAEKILEIAERTVNKKELKEVKRQLFGV